MKPTRSIWTGNITFEHVTIPVRVRAAVQPEAVRFNALHTCGRQIRQKTICPECGEISRSETQNGYPVENGQFVTITADELKACQPASGHTMTIERCVSLREIDPVLFQQSYYLEPEAEDMAMYSLLYQALTVERKCALTRITLHRREHVAILRPWKNCLLLQTLHHEQEIQRDPKLVFPSRTIPCAELSDLCALVNRSAGSFEHARSVDSYQQNIHHLLQEKHHGLSGQNTEQRETAFPAPTVPLASVDEPQLSAVAPYIGVDRTIHVYTGVAQDKKQPKRFAYAFRYLDANGQVTEQVRVIHKCTNNRAELLAVIEALQESSAGSHVVVYTSSTYVSHAGSNLSQSPLREGKWTRKYKNGQVSNAELWREFEKEAASRKVVIKEAHPTQKSRLKSRAEAALLAA